MHVILGPKYLLNMHGAEVTYRITPITTGHTVTTSTTLIIHHHLITISSRLFDSSYFPIAHEGGKTAATSEETTARKGVKVRDNSFLGKIFGLYVKNGDTQKIDSSEMGNPVGVSFVESCLSFMLVHLLNW